MENRAVSPDQIRVQDDAFGEEASGAKALVQGVIYWGVLLLGLATPVAGAIWGLLR